MILRVRGLDQLMIIRIRRKSTVETTMIAKLPHFVARHILALIPISAIMDSKCNKIIVILGSNAALDAVLTVHVPTLFCVMKNARPILIAHRLEDAVAMVTVLKRLCVKGIRLRVIIAINRVNV